MRVLLVEDHESLGASLQKALVDHTFVVDWVTSAEEAAAAMSIASYDLLLLDLGLPDRSGLEYLKELRRGGHSLPVLVLTARGGLNDRLDGLDGGADDYLVKPFATAELIARCRALLRRPHLTPTPQETLGNLSVDLVSAVATIDSEALPLSRREGQLLVALIKKKTRLCTRPYLENELYRFDVETSANAIEASVSRLRSMLRAHEATVAVRTVRGVGYVLEQIQS